MDPDEGFYLFGIDALANCQAIIKEEQLLGNESICVCRHRW